MVKLCYEIASSAVLSVNLKVETVWTLNSTYMAFDFADYFSFSSKNDS